MPVQAHMGVLARIKPNATRERKLGSALVISLYPSLRLASAVIFDLLHLLYGCSTVVPQAAAPTSVVFLPALEGSALTLRQRAAAARKLLACALAHLAYSAASRLAVGGLPVAVALQGRPVACTHALWQLATPAV